MKKVKKMSLFATVWNFTEAALLIIAGLLFMIFCTNATLQNIIFYIVGGFMIADGALRVLVDFIPLFTVKRFDELTYEMIVPGCLELAFGITLCCFMGNLSLLTSFVGLYLGIVLIVAGVFLLMFAIAFIARKLFKLYMPVMEIILAAILITLGSLVIVYMRDESVFKIVCLVIAGIVFVVAGLAITTLTIAKLRAVKAIDNTVQAAKQDLKEAQETLDMTHPEEKKKEEPKEGKKPEVEEPKEEKKSIEKKDEDDKK